MDLIGREQVIWPNAERSSHAGAVLGHATGLIVRAESTV
jgi:hypothetical protein